MLDDVKFLMPVSNHIKGLAKCCGLHIGEITKRRRRKEKEEPGEDPGRRSWKKILEEDPGRRSWKKILEEDPGGRSWRKILEEDPGRCRLAVVVAAGITDSMTGHGMPAGRAVVEAAAGNR